MSHKTCAKILIIVTPHFPDATSKQATPAEDFKQKK